MIWRPLRSTLTDAVFPYTTLCRAPGHIVDALLLHPVEDRRGPNQYVGVPYRRHAVGGHRLDLHPRLAVRAAIFDRLEALTFLEREKRALHHLPLILQREVVHQRNEQVERGLGSAALAHGANRVCTRVTGF